MSSQKIKFGNKEDDKKNSIHEKYVNKFMRNMTKYGM